MLTLFKWIHLEPQSLTVELIKLLQSSLTAVTYTERLLLNLVVSKIHMFGYKDTGLLKHLHKTMHSIRSN